MAKTLPNSGMVIPEIGDGPADVTKLTDALTTLDGVIGTLKTNISLLLNGSFINPRSLSTYTDFNDIKQPGIYIGASNTLVASIANCPSGAAGFLVVFAPNAEGSWGVFQLFIPIGITTIYSRQWSWGSTDWPAWRSNT
jgi:hypothetical protein